MYVGACGVGVECGVCVIYVIDGCVVIVAAVYCGGGGGILSCALSVLLVFV